MLKIRIIPTLLWKDFGLVKGVGFDSWRRVGSVLPSIKVYNLREVDELILMDISATEENREPDYESIAEFSEECFVPFTVGGGIKNLDHIKQILRSGADKISINTAAYEKPRLIKEASERYGSQCIVVSIDVKRELDGNYYCYSHRGTTCTGKTVVEWVQLMEEMGAGEILVTSIERDGTLKGYDLELIKLVSTNVSIPVIASGGAGNYLDMHDAILKGNASAVAAASMFHFTEQTPLEAKYYLRESGIPVRNSNTANT
ncbi:glycosyl amidation-associated protein WbuZ [Heliorestis acidaminivorans]|uniref:Imidazole glycerol phosphate synthase subunit HisF n=1 Tax=Heliorestis acidaminivorans TaxID=553427 RepID=A0A6I0EUH0_9FIRM|nr:glycosyl amidation-associated protein WbuZ [Heliorestis acidaminivorans]KAB2952943.1 glycosyl amidation-associated protein WbuZ [Heliorestis acidaminivorans]